MHTFILLISYIPKNERVYKHTFYWLSSDMFTCHVASGKYYCNFCGNDSKKSKYCPVIIRK